MLFITCLIHIAILLTYLIQDTKYVNYLMIFIFISRILFNFEHLSFSMPSALWSRPKRILSFAQNSTLPKIMLISYSLTHFEPITSPFLSPKLIYESIYKTIIQLMLPLRRLRRLQRLRRLRRFETV
jgi:hypothetical protein